MNFEDMLSHPFLLKIKQEKLHTQKSGNLFFPDILNN